MSSPAHFTLEKFANIQINEALDSKITYLKLSDYRVEFTEESLSIFVNELMKRKNRTDIHGIKLVDQNLDVPCIKQLCKLSWLQYLNFSGSNLSNESILLIADSFPSLKFLAISYNPGVTNIDSLQNLLELEELLLDGLQFKMNDVKKKLGTNKNLKRISIADLETNENEIVIKCQVPMNKKNDKLVDTSPNENHIQLSQEKSVKVKQSSKKKNVCCTLF